MGLALGVRDVHIHYRFTDSASEDDSRAVDVLSAAERERAHRFVFDRDRSTFVIAHALLRRALSEYEDVPPRAWTFVDAPEGKPVLAAEYSATNLRFNLTHTAGLVACVVARGRDVGIDAESLDRATDGAEIATRYFSPREVMRLEACG